MVAAPNRVTIVTQAGEWVLLLHSDGTVERERFTPMAAADAYALAESTLERVQQENAAHEAFSKQQAEMAQALVLQNHMDPEVRAKARRVLGVPEVLPTDPPMPALIAPEEPSLWAKAKSWLKAETSLVVDGALTQQAYEARIAACKACEHLDPRDAPRVGFCKACGCGRNARAELTVKGRMPAATCPKGKWVAG
jgi:hypothetical protein